MKCIEDEIPFELPEGWEWCRFTSVTVNRDSERKPISSANRTNVAKYMTIMVLLEKLTK